MTTPLQRLRRMRLAFAKDQTSLTERGARALSVMRAVVEASGRKVQA